MREVADVIDAIPAMPWSVFGWYMIGSVLRGAWMWLSWLQKGAARETNGVQQFARSAQAVIGSAVVAFIWTGSHLWNLLNWLNIDVPFEVGVTPLSSVAAGFLLEMILVERVIGRFEKKGSSDG